MAEDSEENLAVNTPVEWLKILLVLAALIAINAVAFLVSFGAGVIVTLPITLFLGFLLLRDLVPRHRFPRGKV
ncbi:MAG: hypothetical protein ABIW76_09695 [Fibrobacteria bacterium]